MVAAALAASGPALHSQTARARPAAEHLVFHAARIIDPGSGEVIEDGAIEVNGGRILRVGSRRDVGAVPGARVVDWTGKHVVPGFIDVHAHLYGGLARSNSTQPFAARLLLAAGVTAAAAPGSSDPDGDLAMRNRIDAGWLPGPRLFLAGEYLDMRPSALSWVEPVATAEEARRLVGHWASRGAASVKVYASMQGEVLRAAIQHAHEYGLRVAAHLGAVSWTEAIRLGVDEVFHGPMAFPEAHGGPIAPVTTLEGYAALKERSAAADLTATAVRDALALAAAARVVLTPTAVAAEPPSREKHRLDDQQRFYSAAAWAELQKRLARPVEPVDEALVAKLLEFIRTAHAAGCLLATGTDITPLTILPGYALWREMELFAAAGLPPMAVLKAATANGAVALGRGDTLGAIRPGYLADFVALDADPLAEVGHVRRVHRVVKGGVEYVPEDLVARLAGRVE
jgi:enamidase